ncbi:hypothetical protein [Saccharopolyspora hordei]|uniref:Uncharacterized protein n=1 Tax=Saccharopolyspora hordei TaxID=1838 RepID=A0A853AGK0_9PSEU|nr:hypothetical protein [Saccharopolyspora hordei]NYI83265.1 hypothetical protein [Saccharopolyspora hordei]
MTGEQANTQRETTPLRRDNSRIQQDRAPVDSGPGQTTRPVFPPPSQPAPPPGPAQQTSQPGYQHPPVQQSSNPPVRPVVNPPTSRQPVPEPPPAEKRITPLGWVLRGAVLVAISVVSGLVWLAVKPSPPEEEAAPPPPMKYQFEPLRREEGFRGCQNVSDDAIREFFKNQECDHLTRALYETRLPDGTRVLTSVVTVLMPDAESAQRLDELTTEDDTGNIRDLVDDGSDNTKDLPKLHDKAYASDRQDNLVVIGDSAYFDKKTKEKDPVLLDVTREALKLGWPQEDAPS